MLGPHYRVSFARVAASRSYPPGGLHDFLLGAAPPVVERRVRTPRPQEPRCVSSESWLLAPGAHRLLTGLVVPHHVDLPRSGMETASPALATGVFASEPPGKPCHCKLSQNMFSRSVVLNNNAYVFSCDGNKLIQFFKPIQGSFSCEHSVLSYFIVKTIYIKEFVSPIT